MADNSSAAVFATTCWSQVRRAAELQGEGEAALEELCRQYWYPLYAFLRRTGHAPEAAQDHVQSFFADLLSRQSLRHADPSRGRFRTFLLTACRHHVANRKRAQRSVRRGGRKQLLSLDAERGEDRYCSEAVDRWTPERLYERQWALTVIDAAFARVRASYEAKDRVQRFDVLRPLVAPSGPTPSHAEVAATLDCSPGAVKVAVHRLRQQLGEALREEIARTLDVDEEDEAIEQELSLLLQVLSEA